MRSLSRARQRVFMIGLLLIPLLASANLAVPVPGVVRQTNNVYLVENHSSAGMVWYRSGMHGATVIHLDAHDDCRFVPLEKLEALARLKEAKAWEEIFRLSDLSFVSGFSVRPEATLFDLGNFIYPFIADGTVSHLIWVVPDLVLNDLSRARLKSHLTSALHLQAPEFTDHKDGSFSFPLLKGAMTVTTLKALPVQPAGAILDLDIDFFAFPHALTDIHLKGDLQWSPEAVCDRLQEIVPKPALTTISASVYGGYLPLMFRFLADACFDQLAFGRFSAYARQHLNAIQSMRRNAAPVPLDPAPANIIYRAAHEHFAGLLDLLQNRTPSAFEHFDQATHLSPVYRKAWLDSAEALRRMGALQAAMESIDRFERTTGKATTESRTERAHLLRHLDRFDEAERIARELTDWNPDPHLLLLHGGILAQMQRYKEAAAIYRRILTAFPQDELAHYNLAYVYQQQGKRVEAMAQYRSALAIRDDFAAAHENLGYLLMLDEQFADAEHHLRKALKINPQTATAWGNLGFVLLKLDHPDEAVVCYRKALDLAPDTAELEEGMTNALQAAAQTP